MTTRKPSPRPRPITLDQARADDLLLDALGRGEPAPGDDEIAALLATWRAELAEDADIEAEIEEDQPALAPVVRPAFGSWRVRLVAAVALVVALAGGTTLAAADAGPGSPLWPVTKIVNPDHAGAVTAQTTLDQARAAINQGRPADARRLLDQAQDQIAAVRDPGTAQRLRDQLDTLRRTLAAVVPVLPGSGPVVVPAPGGTPTVGGAGSAPVGGGTGAGGGATNGTGGGGTGPTSGTGGNGGGGTGGGGILPTGIPSAPVPSILPSLPGLK